MDRKENRTDQLPDCVAAYIKRIVRRLGLTRRVRRDVLGELTDHFVDALGECTDEQDGEKRKKRGRELIEQFGNVKLLGKLIRRGKKRCRPPWKKAIIRAAQAAAVLVICFAFYTWWFVSGTPTINTDYLAMLNRITRPAAADEQNAWSHYKQAIDLYVQAPQDPEHSRRMFWRDTSLPGATDTKRADLAKWIADNEPAWAEFVAGSRKEHCWVEYATGAEETILLSVSIPPLSALRRLGRQGILRAKLKAEGGDIAGALQDCLTVARFGAHWQRPGSTLIEQLVGMAVSNHAHIGMLSIVASHSASAGDLAATQQALQRMYSDGYPMMDLEFERLTFVDTVQWLFTEGGPGGGHLIPMKFLNFLGAVQGPGDGMGFDDAVKLTGLSMIHAGRDETLAVADRFYRRMNEIMKLSPYQKRQQELNNWAEGYLQSLPRLRYSLLHVLVPSLDMAGDIAYRGKALHEATITILALRHWQLDKGEYPKMLDELVAAKYLTALPADPYGAGPLVYRRDGDGFILYSVAADFVDDGGRAAETWSGWGKKNKPGDKVFWPVAKTEAAAN